MIQTIADWHSPPVTFPHKTIQALRAVLCITPSATGGGWKMHIYRNSVGVSLVKALNRATALRLRPCTIGIPQMNLGVMHRKHLWCYADADGDSTDYRRQVFSPIVL